MQKSQTILSLTTFFSFTHTLSPSFAMSTSPSLPSFLTPNPNPNPNTNPNSRIHTSFYLLRHNHRYHHHNHFRTLILSPIRFSADRHHESDPAPPEKRSLSVATGELFIGIASLLVGGPKLKRKTPVVLSEESSLGDDDEERIAAVIEDLSEPAVLWEQRVKDVEAERRRKAVTTPGFSFSAAGLLFPYHLGVAQFLLENGFIKETTPLAGSSAGAIVCAVIASGKSMQDALEATKVLADDCRLRGTAFRLGAVLRDVLDKVLPDDIHIRCSGRVRVAVTQIVWRPRGLLVDQFDSREDLINALITSSFIPGYLAPRPVTMFRNKVCIDGGLTLFMPPTSASKTVRVCAFPASTMRLRGVGISPDCNPDNKLSNRQLLNFALEPADDSMLDKLFEFGYSDAAVWAQENPANSIVQEDILV
ncbi:hypothetical protein RND81_11G200400 [Saponaria officinalis]|uniref:Patatin n=1 Tax=Saponaria officinalis TaxID=3572 RepID=A0AAW1HP90_SAPOF